MTNREAAERLRLMRQELRNIKDREALQLAEQALIAQERQTQMLRDWQAWTQPGATQAPPLCKYGGRSDEREQEKT